MYLPSNFPAKSGDVRVQMSETNRLLAIIIHSDAVYIDNHYTNTFNTLIFRAK